MALPALWGSLLSSLAGCALQLCCLHVTCCIVTSATGAKACKWTAGALNSALKGMGHGGDVLCGVSVLIGVSVCLAVLQSRGWLHLR